MWQVAGEVSLEHWRRNQEPSGLGVPISCNQPPMVSPSGAKALANIDLNLNRAWSAEKLAKR